MRIAKVLNNNVVIAADARGIQKVLMGKGLGFKARPGDELKADLVEKVFSLEDAKAAADAAAPALPEGVPPELFALCREFVAQAGERLQLSFHNSLTLALADHLYYALQRLSRGEHIVNALLQEIKQFYPAEYALGQEALELIYQKSRLQLPEDEAGFIALHLVNASLNEDMSATLDVTRLIADILSIVKAQLGELEEKSLDYTRFITHLKFFAQRLLLKQELPQGEDFLFEEVRKHYPLSYSCVQRIGLYVKKKYGHDISKDEITFLTVHVERLRHGACRGR